MDDHKEFAVKKMLEYCSGIADEFLARMNRIRSYVPKHNLSSGTTNETILRNFLKRLSSGRYQVSQGFICDPTAPNSVSKQCDILVYDYHDYPLVYSESDIDIVFPQSAKMVIEVKTKLTSRSLKGALENIESARKLNKMINGVIFAFDGSSGNSIVNTLQRLSSDISPETAPIAILVLEKGLIIHRWPGTPLGGTSELFVTRKSENNAVIAFLLLMYYDVMMQTVWGGASIMNMLQMLLDKQTTPFVNDIKIGSFHQ